MRLEQIAAQMSEVADPEFVQGLVSSAKGASSPRSRISAMSFGACHRAPRRAISLVLCALAGRRPKLLPSERVGEIELLLRGALAAAKGDTTHIRCLWAIVRYDCYILNGLREPEPTAQELLTGVTSLERLRVKELTSAIAAPGNRVWEAVVPPDSVV